jgi:flagellar motor switch protein FliG
VTELLRNEHHQIISILVPAEFDQSAAAVLKQFSERTRNDVMLRIATLTSARAQGPLNEVLYKECCLVATWCKSSI